MVVDLAVEHDVIAPAGGRHRLMASFGEIHHRETPMPEDDSRAPMAPQSVTVRSAVFEPCAASLHCFREIVLSRPCPNDAAHQWPPSRAAALLEGVKSSNIFSRGNRARISARARIL